MGIELRCEKRLHGVINDLGILEVGCRSALCGHRDGVVVIHKFDVVTGEFLETKLYKDYPTVKEQADGLGHSTAVRDQGHQGDPVHHGREHDSGHGK